MNDLYSCFAPFQHLLNFQSGVSEITGFYLLQLVFSVPLLTFNWNILQHLQFEVLSSCQSRVVLVVLLSPFTLAPLLAYFIYIFSSFSLNSCGLPTHCLALSQIIAVSLSFSHFFVKNQTFPVWFSLDSFSEAVLFQMAYSKFFSQEFYLFCKKKKRSFQKVSSISC